jgi:hypothetical protein
MHDVNPRFQLNYTILVFSEWMLDFSELRTLIGRSHFEGVQSQLRKDKCVSGVTSQYDRYTYSC